MKRPNGDSANRHTNKKVASVTRRQFLHRRLGCSSSRRIMAPKKDAVLGDAHKLFEKYSSKNGTHSGKLIKKQLTALMEAMQADQRFLFTSKVELTKWVGERFKEFDVDGNKALSLEEFVKFYRGFLCRSPEQVQAQLKKTQNEMERCFLLFDKNHDFAPQKAELMQFMRSRVPSGLAAAVTDQQLSDLLDTMDFFGKYDVNKVPPSERARPASALVHAQVPLCLSTDHWPPPRLLRVGRRDRLCRVLRGIQRARRPGQRAGRPIAAKRDGGRGLWRADQVSGGRGG